MEAPIAGGSPVTLASAQTTPEGIAVDGTGVYWADDIGSGGPRGTIMKVPLDGGAAVSLVSGQAGPQNIATDGKNVYWTTASLNVGTIMAAPAGYSQSRRANAPTSGNLPRAPARSECCP